MGELRRPATKKQQSRLSSDVRYDDKVVRCSQCTGLVVNGDERHFYDDVIFACGYGYEPELPQHCESATTLTLPFRTQTTINLRALLLLIKLLLHH